jgi:hypothetical protein
VGGAGEHLKDILQSTGVGMRRGQLTDFSMKKQLPRPCTTLACPHPTHPPPLSEP